MRDKFTEDTIVRERNDGNIMLIALCIVLAVILILLNLLGIIFGGYILGGIAGFMAYYFSTRQNVEYEFSMTNEMIDVDAIYNRQQRKNLYAFNLTDAKVMAPTNSLRLEGERTGSLKMVQFTSGLKDRETYSIIGEFNGTKTEVVIEPTEKILEHLKFFCKDRYYEG